MLLLEAELALLSGAELALLSGAELAHERGAEGEGDSAPCLGVEGVLGGGEKQVLQLAGHGGDFTGPSQEQQQDDSGNGDSRDTSGMKTG